MIVFLKKKHTLQVDDFYFKCSIGKNGISKKKTEGDNRTPEGNFKIEHLYFRKDRIEQPQTSLKSIEIKKNMGWCDDVSNSKNYNKLININKNIHHEKLFRKDHKYDLLIPIKYNFDAVVLGIGSCIFIHLTDKYQPTAGCIGLGKKDFLILLKLINKNTRIKIY
tara:strand:- start:7524 stop:8018 length:495 start_codon:yes stop_codon:yes gene_type:complete